VFASLRDSPTAAYRSGILAGTGGLKPLSLVTFFAAAKKVTAAPHRGNANKPIRQRGCQQKPKTKNQKSKTKPHRE
jgi:general secretion pathway protein K